MKIILYILLLSSLISCSVYNHGITEKDLENHIRFLASDSLKGRYPGTPEDSVLQLYLTGEFRKYGLTLFQETGLQPFSFISGVKAGQNEMEVAGRIFIQGSDFTPFNFSANAKLKSEVVFAGYGIVFQNDTLHWDNYEGLDIKGKWILMFRGIPPLLAGNPALGDHLSDRDKALKAKDMGAGGVLLVSPSAFDLADQLSEPRRYQFGVGIPVIHITREVAGFLLSGKTESLTRLEGIYPDTTTAGFTSGVELTASTEVIPMEITTSNIVAYLPGKDSVRKKEILVIGAHYDHLGMGGPGSSSRQSDTVAVHYGADDNASGVASVLELAAWFSSRKQFVERTLVFALFGAEEIDLLGSKQYTANPPFPLEQTKMMLNMDMVGRMRPDSSLSIGGTGTTHLSEEILNNINEAHGFKLQMNKAGYAPSDHAPFYAENIPVLFFSTGVHPDYHTPRDRTDSLNLPAQEGITKYIASVIRYFANLDTIPPFTEAGPNFDSTVNFRGRVTLGIMPEVGNHNIPGVKVMAVLPGRPAALAGILKGDIIVAIDGNAVESIYDYMSLLILFNPGQTVGVSVLREKRKVDLLIQL